MEKKVKVEKKQIGLKASAGTVRRYRDAFGADLLLDMSVVEGDLISNKCLTAESTKIGEQVAWIMAKEYDPSIPELEEWLEQFSPYFVLLVAPHIIQMWRDNLHTLNESKKS